jgi:hypothetical protein
MMPSPDTILIGLAAIADDWRWLAITWHVLVAALLAAFLAGWRPSARFFGYVLIGPLLTVSLAAWLSGNPFNGLIFAGIAVALFWSVAHLSRGPLQLAAPAAVSVGIALVTFGLVYPHFLQAASWKMYLYAAPFGLVPCPTLTVAIGATLVFRNFRSPSWSAVLATAGLIYGVIGVFGLGVALDWGLLFAATMLGVVQRATPTECDRDELLDRFMPAYDVVERHHIRIAAPAAVTFAAAREQDLFRLPIVRAIIRARELLLGATGDDRPRPRGLLAATQALGWGILAEVPDREIVVGAVTRPWEPNVTFLALPPNEFAAFRQPGFVKIAWTLRADPLEAGTSIFRTETRAVATDSTARTRFRRYWTIVSPGIALIRLVSLRPLRRAAERCARTAGNTILRAPHDNASGTEP